MSPQPPPTQMVMPFARIRDREHDRPFTVIFHPWTSAICLLCRQVASANSWAHEVRCRRCGRVLVEVSHL